MIDFVSPLGRPPLDTFTPTQEVRTADILPVGIWEVELGASQDGGSDFFLSALGIRTGVRPSLELDLGIPSARRALLTAAYGLIPGLVAFDASWTPDKSAGSNRFEIGSQIQLETPWGTPRLAPRLGWIPAHGGPLGPLGSTWQTQVDLSYDLPFGERFDAGADLDVDALVPAKTDVALGLRVRLFDNVGGAIYGSYSPWSTSVGVGVLLATRFFGG